MCSDVKIIVLCILLPLVSCSQIRRLESIRRGDVTMSICVPTEKPLTDESDEDVVVDSIRSTLTDEPFIMNAIRDTETGEMVATDVIKASTVMER